MPKKTFISFKSEDILKVWALRGLSHFQNVAFEMDDVSLRESVDSKEEAYIKSVIRPKIKSCDVCLCLIGENTFRSRKWVPWEVRLASEEGKTILAMRLKDMNTAITPAVLSNLGIIPFDWDIEKLFVQIGR
ncbi:TIR domain-containing protein [Salmonirosea aquatica]|uniref:TIR domain-containing protein n=1 Tax=Salmonirosea aquatica TaxID=2654236 RepID=A0A7C9BL94_9BACT|nr:TIR domain-containing protein [Cytophagaceae bacterium SJW1-29]